MFKDIRNIIPRSIKRAGISREVAETDVFALFKKAGEKVLRAENLSKLKPVFFKSEVLFIASLSDAAIRDLKDNESEIIEYINNILEKEDVKKLKIMT